jgi:hypothetical protein
MSNQAPNKRKLSTLSVIFLITALLLPSAIIYTAYSSDSNAKSYRDRCANYIRNGMTDEAIKELEKVVEFSYNEGYDKGKKDTTRQITTKVYIRYMILSVVAGLYFAAVFVAILWWSDISSHTMSIRKVFRIRGIIKRIGTKLNPEMRNRALEIINSKEKLQDAIKQENDAELNGLASNVLPRLDELVRQALLLLERQQILSDYIKDMDPTKLENDLRECEQKIKAEKDQEAKTALEYQLTQVKNKQDHYSKAKARIRTSDAVLKGIAARIDATSLDLMSLPSILIRKQEFFERISVELDEEIDLTTKAAETLMEDTT